MSFDGVKLATMQKRGLAFFIDEIIVSFLVILIYFDYFSGMQTLDTNPEDIANIVAAITTPYVILKVLYHFFFIYCYSATLGKMAMKIKVVSSENLKPNFGSSALRASMRIISESVFYIGFIWAFFDPIRQSWHDKVAKTVVVDVS